MLEFDPVPTISGGGLDGTYEFLQYHFHWGGSNNQGSEHTLEGVEYVQTIYSLFIYKLKTFKLCCFFVN